jgi:hypothetical protein
VDYGDGSGPQDLPPNPDKTFALSHVYADDQIQPYIVTVAVTDSRRAMVERANDGEDLWSATESMP